MFFHGLNNGWVTIFLGVLLPQRGHQDTIHWSFENERDTEPPWFKSMNMHKNRGIGSSVCLSKVKLPFGGLHLFHQPLRPLLAWSSRKYFLHGSTGGPPKKSFKNEEFTEPPWFR